MNNDIKGCGKQLNPNGSDDRCGQADSVFGPEGAKRFCQSCRDKHRIFTLEQGISKAAGAQVSALDIKPGTVVVLRLVAETPIEHARYMGKEIQRNLPFNTPIFVLPNGEQIESLSEDQMRQMGWVPQRAVDELVVAMEEVLRISDRQHDAWDRAKEVIASLKGGAA